MNRSTINKAIAQAKELFETHQIGLPPFGYWELADWQENHTKTKEIRTLMLGWDVTDFGQGDYERVGATLFTLRNGSFSDPTIGTPFAEKLIVLQDEQEQEIPFHYHAEKVEDIINRAGGTLLLEFYHATKDDQLDLETPISLRLDGVRTIVTPGEVVELMQGQSVTIPAYLYHRFWAKRGDGPLIAGEISSVNDDTTDNVFLDPTERFSSIVEDEPIVHPLCNEYSQVLD